MRALSVLLVAALAAAVPSVATAQAKPRAELVTKGVAASLAGGQVTVAASVKNKGSKKAKGSSAGFFLSTDVKHSADDKLLGAIAVGKIKPHKKQALSGSFAVPTGTAPGSYRVVACADVDDQVKERTETNNCKATPGTITVAVTVSATAGPGGTVAASGVTGGSCAGTVCTFPNPGTRTVTFTPTPASDYRFGAWTGATCTGQATGADNAITFTNPTTSKTCAATFVKQVTVSFSAEAGATVSATASNGTCTSGGSGSCHADAGVGTVVLTASAGSYPVTFAGWTGATCDGEKSGRAVTFYAPGANKSCTATYAVAAGAG